LVTDCKVCLDTVEIIFSILTVNFAIFVNIKIDD